MKSAYDVVVIGAGAAGLRRNGATDGSRPLGAAARCARPHRRPGLDTSRAGTGRAGGARGRSSSSGEAHTTRQWIERAGHGSHETLESHFRLINGRLAQQDGYFADVQRAFRRNRERATDDLSFADYLNVVLKDELSPQARRAAIAMAEGIRRGGHHSRERQSDRERMD